MRIIIALAATAFTLAATPAFAQTMSSSDQASPPSLDETVVVRSPTVIENPSAGPAQCAEAQTILREARELQAQGEAERQLNEPRRRLDTLGPYIESIELRIRRQEYRLLMSIRQLRQRMEERLLVMHAEAAVDNLCSR